MAFDAGSTIDLYDAFAAEYDESFEARSLRRVYDTIAWDHVAARLPRPQSTVVDVGCGTGRWVARCLQAGHRVIGIEPAPRMRAILQRKFGDTAFTLLSSGMEEAVIEPGSADAVLAMGSLQYAADPAAALRRMRGWLRPGGLLCVHVDGLVALTFELLRLGRTEEALTRMRDGWGVFSYGEHQARLHLFNRSRLTVLLAQAGLVDVETRGLLVAASALGRAACEAMMAQDEAAFMALERALSASDVIADGGKHVMAWGRRGS